MHFTYKEHEFNFVRYPETTNRSLRAWSAGEEYVLSKLEELDLSSKTIAIYNDRFGFLSCTLNQLKPFVVIDRKSQQKAIEQNLTLNKLKWNPENQFSPLGVLPAAVDIGIINIPKTLDLFRLYLNNISQALSDDGMVICTFMTKYFTPQLLELAGEFFEEVEQSLARKKSRLLILKNKKSKPDVSVLNFIPYSFDGETEEELKQYAGVFSGDHIDYATQFLIQNLKVEDGDESVLDLGAGNGVIARAIQLKKPETELHLVDDSRLAVESSKLNLESLNNQFHWNDTLENFSSETFDLVVSNPPFHFGHETNIEVSIKLFQEVAEVLKPSGRFICVANQHLNYKTHLEKIFKSVEVIAENEKYILYQSKK